MKIFSLLFLIALFAAAPDANAQKPVKSYQVRTIHHTTKHTAGGQTKSWVDYEPAVIELKGTLRVKTYFGPPNFGEEPKTDSKEKEWILVLKEPINVRGKTGPDVGDDAEPVENVRELELVLLGRHQELIGKKVTVTGTLFHAFSGHHHTDVLMSVKSIGLS